MQEELDNVKNKLSRTLEEVRLAKGSIAIDRETNMQKSSDKETEAENLREEVSNLQQKLEDAQRKYNQAVEEFSHKQGDNGHTFK